MKICKIVASWLLMVVGLLALLVMCGGAIDGVLRLCRWVLDSTIGLWGIPVCVAILFACVLLFFAINPMEQEDEE